MPPSRDVTQWEGTPKRRRRYGAVVPILVAVIGATLLGRLASLDSGHPEELEVVAASESPTPTPRPRPSRSPRPSPTPTPRPTPIGSWRELEPEPLDTRYSATTLWTGRHLIVWGGTEGHWPARRQLVADGAMWSPADRRWTSLPAHPLPERQSETVAWTGDALFMWGGTDASGHRSDGAIYEPSTGWSILPPSPLSPRHGAAAGLDGDEMLIVGGWDNLGARHDGAAYNLRTGRWRKLPRFPVAAAEGIRATASPHGPVFWEQGYGDGTMSAPMRYDNARNRWRRLGRGTDDHAAGTITAVAAVGRDLYAASSTSPLQILRLSDGRGEWESVATLRDRDAWAPQLIPAERHLFVVTMGPQLAAERLNTRTLESVPLPPERSLWQEMTAVWTGRQLVIRGITGYEGNVNGPIPDAVQTHLVAWHPRR